MKKLIYLDYNSTTPVDPRVLESMLPYFSEKFGNAANSLHAYGWSAESAIQKAHEQVAELLHCKPYEIVWNSGATEGNNTVLHGVLRYHLNHSLKPIHFLASAIEHPSILKVLEELKINFPQFDYDIIRVDQNGLIDIDDLQKKIRPTTALVSVMWVNNEIGVIQDIQKIADLCQENKIYFHTDATQAIGKVKIDLAQTPIHLMTCSSHKMYGPKGIGFLYSRSINPHVSYEPFIKGGGHQKNRRSGTLNTPAIVGAGEACAIVQRDFDSEIAHFKKLQKSLYEKIMLHHPSAILNGPSLSSEQRSAINLNFTFPQKMIDLHLPALSEIAFSMGSACHTADVGHSASHVLLAIGKTFQDAACTMRLSVGRLTTSEDIEKAVEIITNAFTLK